jgi:hypothetical protein
MEESAEEALKRDETLRIYHSTKEALKIMDDVARDTIQEISSIKKYEPEPNSFA